MTYTMTAAFTLIFAVSLVSELAKSLENHQLWTLRLRLSTIRHYFIIPATFTIWVLLGYELIFRYPMSMDTFKSVMIILFIAGAFISILNYALPAYQNRGYLRLRWKAWTGPSRTGITAEFVPYIGNRRDWEMLDTLARGKVVMHPVEKVSAFPFSLSRHLIMADATDLLKERAAADREHDHHWTPHGDVPEGVFQPVVADRPASLIWGEQIGFQRRCSRGIISVSSFLLAAQPKLTDGLDGRGLCLACGILARNKGLNPVSFTCNLRNNDGLGIFERESVFWPRPAKTLRSVFYSECKRLFSQLGPVFVTVATELALLLTDAPVEVAEDWLDGQLEHQDLELNNEAYRLGADVEDLSRLYRGHYAAMLVSLNSHYVGVRVRPELHVYEALCGVEGVEPGAWFRSAGMLDRKRRELEVLGPRVLRLVGAVV